MPSCAASGCTNSSDKQSTLQNVPTDASFHSFPLQNPELLEQWLRNMDRKDFKPTKSSKLCSVHFLPNCFDVPVPPVGSKQTRYYRRRLLPHSVPTEFAWRRPPPKREVGEEMAPTEPSPKLGTVHEHEEPMMVTVSPSAEQLTVHRKRKPSSTITREILQTEGDESTSQAAMFISTESQPLQTGEIVSGSTPSIELLEEVTPMESVQLQTPEPKKRKEQVAETVQAEFKTPQRLIPHSAPTTSKLAVHSLFGTPRRTMKDHPYAVSKKFRTLGMQTESLHESPVKQPEEPISSPLASPLTSPLKSEGLEGETSEYTPFSQTSAESSSDSSDAEKQSDPSKIRKFIVFEDKLNELHKFCRNCGSPVVSCSQFTRGSMVGYNISCHQGHTYVWHSQPLEQKQPVGNLLIAAAVLLTGGTFGKLKAFADALGLLMFSKTVFNKLQKMYMLPAIQEYWEKERRLACDGLKEVDPIVLSGDGRCDSPGHSAKYGSYTLMHTDGSGETGTRKIVSMKLVQVSEVKNSNHMEPEGLKRCLKEVADENLKIDVFATDRHIMISSIMKKEYKEIDHQFDTWHVAKGIIKKLAAKAKLKNCLDLAPWIQSISNHLWWACATCGEDKQVLREKWLSLLHHVKNKHQWSGNQKFHECEHPPLSHEDQKAVKWLKPKSPAFLALQKLLLDTKLLKAIGQLNKFCHTGELEVFHSMLLKFCPKRQHFHYDAMTGRLMLAAIEWNKSEREQKTDQRGKPATSVEFSKRRKTFVLKNRYHKVTLDYTGELLTRICQVHRDRIQLKPIERPEHLPQTVATIEKPSKEELEEKFRSRFK